MYGVVHNELDAKEFEEFLQADVFLDSEKVFYGPEERWIGFGEFVKPSNWINFYTAWRDGFSGNTEGEGRLLGGLYVIQRDKVILECRAKEIGVTCPLDVVKGSLEQLR